MSGPIPLEARLPPAKNPAGGRRTPPSGFACPSPGGKKLPRGGELVSPRPGNVPSLLPLVSLWQAQQPLLNIKVSFFDRPPLASQALLDTGADLTVMPQVLARGLTDLQDTTILGAGGKTHSQFKLLRCPVHVYLPFRRAPVSLPSCLIDTKNEWTIIGRDVLQQCQGALYLPEDLPAPTQLSPVTTPAVIGLEHLPEPPEVSQFPLNLNASRP
ncbi:protease [Simian T-cell lymphotropic virus 4]|nr:protease [Simian T-cell lymphotropic virus 4]AHH34957.1 protease [Simian T-cell lymphotropic virus 4]AHH34961.1 protease [Simian T-cell lymphotropic virus 4]AHH34965.1 protease [Simian T-cell lymphotropic virus 4]AHH34969.1 protease [Simian T-cell lymphotropic virus 4]